MSAIGNDESKIVWEEEEEDPYPHQMDGISSNVSYPDGFGDDKIIDSEGGRKRGFEAIEDATKEKKIKKEKTYYEERKNRGPRRGEQFKFNDAVYTIIAMREPEISNRGPVPKEHITDDPFTTVDNPFTMVDDCERCLSSMKYLKDMNQEEKIRYAYLTKTCRQLAYDSMTRADTMMKNNQIEPGVTVIKNRFKIGSSDHIDTFYSTIHRYCRLCSENDNPISPLSVLLKQYYEARLEDLYYVQIQEGILDGISRADVYKVAISVIYGVDIICPILNIQYYINDEKDKLRYMQSLYSILVDFTVNLIETIFKFKTGNGNTRSNHIKSLAAFSRSENSVWVVYYYLINSEYSKFDPVYLSVYGIVEENDIPKYQSEIEKYALMSAESNSNDGNNDDDEYEDDSEDDDEEIEQDTTVVATWYKTIVDIEDLAQKHARKDILESPLYQPIQIFADVGVNGHRSLNSDASDPDKIISSPSQLAFALATVRLNSKYGLLRAATPDAGTVISAFDKELQYAATACVFSQSHVDVQVAVHDPFLNKESWFLSRKSESGEETEKTKTSRMIEFTARTELCGILDNETEPTDWQTDVYIRLMGYYDIQEMINHDATLLARAQWCEIMSAVFTDTRLQVRELLDDIIFIAPDGFPTYEDLVSNLIAPDRAKKTIEYWNVFRNNPTVLDSKDGPVSRCEILVHLMTFVFQDWTDVYKSYMLTTFEFVDVMEKFGIVPIATDKIECEFTDNSDIPFDLTNIPEMSEYFRKIINVEYHSVSISCCADLRSTQQMSWYPTRGAELSDEFDITIQNYPDKAEYDLIVDNAAWIQVGAVYKSTVCSLNDKKVNAPRNLVNAQSYSDVKALCEQFLDYRDSKQAIAKFISCVCRTIKDKSTKELMNFIAEYLKNTDASVNSIGVGLVSYYRVFVKDRILTSNENIKFPTRVVINDPKLVLKIPNVTRSHIMNYMKLIEEFDVFTHNKKWWPNPVHLNIDRMCINRDLMQLVELEEHGDADLDEVGDADLDEVGEADPDEDGDADLDEDGDADLDEDGDADLDEVGDADLDEVGDADLDEVGDADLDEVGEADPDEVGDADPDEVGDADLDAVDKAIPDAVGKAIPDAVGKAIPNAVGEAMNAHFVNLNPNCQDLMKILYRGADFGLLGLMKLNSYKPGLIVALVSRNAKLLLQAQILHVLARGLTKTMKENRDISPIRNSVYNIIKGVDQFVTYNDIHNSKILTPFGKLKSMTDNEEEIYDRWAEINLWPRLNYVRQVDPPGLT